MAFLRHRQRVLTSLFPHQANKQFIIPKRFGLIPQGFSHKTISINSVFQGVDVSGTLVTTGFSVLQDSTPVAVGSVDQSGGTNAITVNHAAVIAGEKTTLHYDGSGDWIGANGYKVGPFTSTQVTT